MSTLKKITWAITVLFALWFIYRWVHALGINTAYGSPGSSPAYIFGLLFASGIIPGIMWVIVYFIEKKKNKQL